MALTRITNRLRAFSKRLTENSVARDARQCDSAWYDRVYAQSDEYAKPYYKCFYYFLWTVIVDRVRRHCSQNILDIGCGPGHLAQFLLDQGARNYTGLDFSQEAIRIARSNVPEATFIVGDARISDVYDLKQYDLIICTEVLEHINEDLDVILRFGKRTRCICTVPSFPYDSHVRNFECVERVTERYSCYFDDFDVLELPSPRQDNDKFFLFEGVRTS